MVNFERITPCGECCVGCPKRAQGLCEGCRESDGHCREWKDSGGCPIYRCAKEHKALFCGLCECFPCDWLPSAIVWRSDVVRELAELADEYRGRMNGMGSDTQRE